MTLISMKPHEPSLVQFVERLSELDDVTGVTGKLVEIEEDVRTVRIAIEGEGLDLDVVDAEIADLSASIHSIDEVSCGDHVVDDPWISGR